MERTHALLIVFLLAAVVASFPAPATGQDLLGSDTLGGDVAENLAAGRSPTDLLSRARLRSTYLTLRNDAIAVANTGR